MSPMVIDAVLLAAEGALWQYDHPGHRELKAAREAVYGMSVEIATLRGLLAETRKGVSDLREFCVGCDWVSTEYVADALARIDAALSPAVPTRHTTSPGADAGAGPDSGSEEER